MSDANFTLNRIGSKPRLGQLTSAYLERICGLSPQHEEKHCDYCGIVLSFPRNFTKCTFCAVCCSLLDALSHSAYWFNVQRQHESEILADIIHKKLLMDGGDADEVSQ